MKKEMQKEMMQKTKMKTTMKTTMKTKMKTKMTVCLAGMLTAVLLLTGCGAKNMDISYFASETDYLIGLLGHNQDKLNLSERYEPTIQSYYDVSLFVNYNGIDMDGTNVNIEYCIFAEKLISITMTMEPKDADEMYNDIKNYLNGKWGEALFGDEKSATWCYGYDLFTLTLEGDKVVFDMTTDM